MDTHDGILETRNTFLNAQPFNYIVIDNFIKKKGITLIKPIEY